MTDKSPINLWNAHKPIKLTLTRSDREKILLKDNEKAKPGDIIILNERIKQNEQL